MRVFASSVVDVDALAQVIGYALAAAIGVTAAFSLTILGATRFAELRRDRRLVLAGTFALVLVLALAVVAAAVVFGFVVMTEKS